ncbi:MAG: DUF4214 domain-containing protein [Pirellulales bacterium]
MFKRPRRLQLEPLEGRQMMANFPLADAVGVDLDSGEYALPEAPPPSSISIVQELPLRSLPGAAATLFLDFNGHFQEETVGDWKVPLLDLELGGWSNFSLPAYDRDGDPLNFSPQEQEEIRFIWAAVAEDYAPFNINVTTVDPDPGRYHPEYPYLRVVISGGSDVRDGENSGGFAEYDAYANGNDPNVAFVFLKDKDIPAGEDGHLRDFRFIADAASHEAGHAFGLEHYDNDTGNSDKAPIMESNGAWPAKRGTWWRGTDSYYSGPQDDMAEIAGDANGFGYRPDDHNNGLGGATQLTVASSRLIGHGVIEKTSDVDTFRFMTGGGDLSIWVMEADAPNHLSVGNLDAVLRLLDANGALIAENNDPNLLWANVDATLAAGTYYVQVASNGAYGDVGQYDLRIFEHTGPRVVSSQLLPLSDAHGVLLVTFNEPVNPNTFTTADVRINEGPVGAGVVSIGPPIDASRTFLVTFTKPTTTFAAQLSISIGPNIMDFFSNSMDQNQNGLTGGEDPFDYYTASFWAGGTATYDGWTTPPDPEPELGHLAQEAILVDRLYQQVLGRGPDPAGSEHWTAAIAGGQASVGTIASGIFESDERLDPIVARMYRDYLFREADASGLAYWRDLVWKRDGAPDNVIAGIVSSEEFYASAGGTHEGWVNEMYRRLLGREAEQGGLDYWSAQLAQGMSRSDVVLGFVQSEENFRNLVRGWHVQYLGRQATAEELERLVGQLRGGVTQRAIQIGLLDSPEYRDAPVAPLTARQRPLSESAFGGEDAASRDSVFMELGRGS